ncbi:hypothetical protein H1D24_03535 [Streptomyces sp. PSKA28]|uniref:Uncharacterized protein n=2 Tax=Streptomyces TaxID=1883 RepID=A0A7W0DH62_9ACTN|nr:hypothetical protein [Streptomyces himalayensis subsp. himalayensis]
MSQPPPQPPQHNPYNPYSQPAPPQQQPGFGPPPVPGQPPIQPMQAGPPYEAPSFRQQTNAGNPVGAVLLGLFASVVVSLIYSGLILATYKDQSQTTAHTLYVAHALLNGVVVGALVGLVGRRSNGARIGAAVIAALGAFFGYTNAIPLIIAESETPRAVADMVQWDTFLPAELWWGSQSGTTWISLLGLVVAAASAWGLAYAVGNRGRGA